MDDRYSKKHNDGHVDFFLEPPNLTEEDSRLLMAKVVEQAIKDYCSLYPHKTEQDEYDWKLAKAFIFNDQYTIQWGDWEVDVEEFLDLINMDISWIRKQTAKKFEEKHGIPAPK